nr:hypothetical protein Iba_chr11aCG5120 [Ipomoea batatas]
MSTRTSGWRLLLSQKHRGLRAHHGSVWNGIISAPVIVDLYTEISVPRISNMKLAKSSFVYAVSFQGILCSNSCLDIWILDQSLKTPILIEHGNF